MPRRSLDGVCVLLCLNGKIDERRANYQYAKNLSNISVLFKHRDFSLRYENGSDIFLLQPAQIANGRVGSILLKNSCMLDCGISVKYFRESDAHFRAVL